VLICEKSELKSTRANIINFDIKTKHANLYYHAREVHVLERYRQFEFLSDVSVLDLYEEAVHLFSVKKLDINGLQL
jgi:hypothetical protein